MIVFLLGAALACGSRTGLLVTDDSAAAGPPSTFDPFSGDPFSGDGGAPGPTADALPPILVPTSLPPNEPPPNDCPDAAATLVYVITDNAVLSRFDPRGPTFTSIGPIQCPTRVAGDTPNSMAVDRTGVAYVGYQSGDLFRVSTATAACRATPFVVGQNGLSQTFGMGFAGVDAGTDRLYVGEMAQPSRLGWIDTTTFALDVVGTFPAAVVRPELTGTAAGDLFVFYQVDSNDSAIAQVDRATAQLLAETTLSGVGQGSAWAFALWGGDFYTFTSPTAADGTVVEGSVVHRFRPADGSVTVVAQYPERILGAGVSTCAPQP